MLLMKYRAAKDKSQNKQNIHFLTTRHRAAMKNAANRDAEGNVVQKPEDNLYYNKKIGGVNKIDQQLNSIQVLRKTFK